MENDSMPMSLSRALQNRQIPLVEVEKSYQQHVYTITQTMTGVLTSSLPTLNTLPPDWQDFTTAYTTAKCEALRWTNQVMASLMEVPEDVQSYNVAIQALLADAREQAQTLIGNPNSVGALDLLEIDLNNVSRTLNLVVTFVSGALDSVQSFQGTLPDLATQLHAIATKSGTDANADQAMIDKLRADVKQLQDDIADLTGAIVGLAIADAAALILGTVATIVAFPEGLLAWLFLGPAIAVATTYIALDSIKIKTDKARIESDESQIDLLSADVFALQTLADQFGQLASQTESLTSDLQAVVAEWQTLESEVNEAIGEITAAMAEASVEAFQSVANDLDQATTLWNEAFDQARSLHLDVQVSTADVETGMSSSQIQSAVTTGTNIGLIKYLNHVGHLQGISQLSMTS